MNFQTRLNRKARRILRSRFGDGVTDHKAVQKLLGLYKRGENIVDNASGLQIEYDPKSYIGSCLLWNGFFEASDIAFCAAKLVPVSKPVVLDIGANIGLHCLSWAKTKSDATIFAFEPSPATGQVLQRNIERNRLSGNIEVVPCAVSNIVGTATFFETEDNAYNSLRDTGRKTVEKAISVPVITVDDFVRTASVTTLSLIKVDVEGFESEVILGAKNTLVTLKPDLFIEISSLNNPDLNSRALIDMICSLGYRASALVYGKLVPVDEAEEGYDNYYFTHLAA